MNLSKRKIFVMRHATVQNPTDMIYSNLPGFPLSELGRRQAEEAGHFLSATPLQFIFTSGRERTRETAEIVARLNPGRPQVIVDDRLRDMGLGEKAGKIPFTDWKANRETYWQKQINGEDGMESPVRVQSRMTEVWNHIIADYPTGNVLLVSHAGPLTILLASLMGQALLSTSEKVYGIGRATVFEVEPTSPVQIKKIFDPTT